MAIWRDLGLTEQSIGGFGGLYESLSPADRPLGALSQVSNLVISPRNVLTTRPGLAAVGAQIGTSALNGVFPYYDTVNGTSQLLAMFGTDLRQYNEGTSAWGSSIATLNDAQATSVNINDLLLIFERNTPRSWNGTALSNLGGSPPAGNLTTVAYEQVFVAGVAATPGDVYFCDDALPTMWAAASDNNAGSITVTAREGDYITWIDFDKVMGKVLVWTRYALLILNGPDTPNRPSLWNVRYVAPYGTPQGRTVRNIGGVWVWLTDKGFAKWSGGNVQVDYDPIKTTFDTIDWSTIANSCAWVDDVGRYWCSVPVTGSAYKWFCWDKDYGWFVGTGASIRASGSYRFSGEETALVGTSDGYLRKFQGTTDAGTAITWSATIGPSFLGDTSHKKELSEVYAILSLASGATCSADVSTAETGSYGTGKTASAGTTISQMRLPLPFAAAEARRSGLFRVRLSGTGVVNLYDVTLRYRQAGR
jgi:hypothetical protein